DDRQAAPKLAVLLPTALANTASARPTARRSIPVAASARRLHTASATLAMVRVQLSGTRYKAGLLRASALLWTSRRTPDDGPPAQRHVPLAPTSTVFPATLVHAQ